MRGVLRVWAALVGSGFVLTGCGSAHSDRQSPGRICAQSPAPHDSSSFLFTSGMYEYTVIDDRGTDKLEMRLVREGSTVRIVEYDSEWPGLGRLEGNSFKLRAEDDEIIIGMEGRLTADNVLEGTVVVGSRDGRPPDRSTFKLRRIGALTRPWRRPPSTPR